MNRIAFSMMLFAIAMVFWHCAPKENNPNTEQVIADSTITDSVVADDDLLNVNLQLRQDVNNPDLYEQRAKIYFDLGDIESAYADINRSLNLDSLNTNYYVTKAGFYFRQKDFLNA